MGKSSHGVWAILVVVVLTAVLAAQGREPTTQPAAGDANSATADGARDGAILPKGYFEKFSPHVRRVIRLRWTQKSPRVDRGLWERTVTPAVREQFHKELLRKFRGYADPNKAASFYSKSPAVGVLWYRLYQKVGGYHSDDDKPWKKKVTRKITNGKLHGTVHTRPDRVVLRLSELVEAPRELYVRDRKGYGFRLLVTDDSARMFISLDAPETGGVRMAYLTPKARHVAEASTFRELYRKNSKVFEQRVFPMLHRLGVSLPPGRSESVVVGAVLSKLKGPMDQAEQEEVAGWIADLGGEKAVREAAADRLNRYYARYRQYVQAALKQGSASPEALDRLKGIAAKHSLPEEYPQIVEALGLLDDPDYLCSLLDDVDSEEKALLAERLAKITDQDFQTDADAWSKWLASRPAPPVPPGADARHAVVEAALGKHRELLSKMACLKWTSQGIRVDQEKWKTAFEGRPESDLLDEIHRYMRAAGQTEERIKRETSIDGMGAPWGTTYSLLYWAAKSRGGGIGSESGLRYRTYYAGLKGGDLNMTIRSNIRKVQMDVREEKAPERRVKIYDDAEGAFRMSFVEPTGRQVVVYNEAKDGKIRLLFLHGQKHVITEAGSLEALYAVHKELLTREIFPMLRAAGVSLPKEAPPRNDPGPVKGPNIKPLRIIVTIYNADPGIPPEVIDLDDVADDDAEAEKDQADGQVDED